MENNKTLRIRTNINEDQYITVNLEQEYDILEILSMKITQKGAYKYSVGDYGVVVGRVLANNGFGVPNAKLSLFIAKNDTNDIIKDMLYPYESTLSKDDEGRRYNLLPDSQKDDCHRVVGTFPNKRVMLDEKSVLEVFDEYYRYTTRTNDAGDYMFYGVPTGSYTLHMDLDISDCGKLSQRPRDFIYKGYTSEQFENPNQFKVDSELSMLPQIFTQDTTIEVKPFWGDSNDNRQVGITRHDIDVAFKFEPTCVFMGAIFTDGPNQGISQKCKPSKRMGEMSELVTGPGRIQIIRKTPANTIEELQLKGTQLIDGNGVWCFQIPMNLDYMMTDEYGNMVPTDSPEKGIPTRCEVRFRLSLEDESDTDVFHNSKVLVPHNPQNESELDYSFGSRTKDFSFKSLMWNNVYTIKSFIPRFQKKKGVYTKNFTGIKKVNTHRENNPMPYNNIRITLPFMFRLMCAIINIIIWIVKQFNILKRTLNSILGTFGFIRPYSYLSGFCEELDDWYFAPGMETAVGKANKWESESVCLTFKDIASQLGDDATPSGLAIELYEWDYDKGDVKSGYSAIITKSEWDKLTNDEQKYYEKSGSSPEKFSNLDEMSIAAQNLLSNPSTRINLTANESYLQQCIETNLAEEYGIVSFDFYNDWINGAVYLPQWKGNFKYKKKKGTLKIKGCMNDSSIFNTERYYMQMCSLSYDSENKVSSDMNTGCDKSKLKCHESHGAHEISVFGKHGGVVHDGKTSLGDSIYYLKPYEFKGNKAIPFFATDIVMLGSLFDCNEYGLPTTFDSLVATTYQLPPNLAQTNLDEDGDTFSSGGVKLEDVRKWECGEEPSMKGKIMSGVTKQRLTYDDIAERLSIKNGTTERIILEYDDVYPVTEVSGIDWGYNGAGYKGTNGKEILDKDKMLAPGGHFLGLSCNAAETNIRSCVNLKRACEIGTSLSERLEVPVGDKETIAESEYKFDVVKYLYVAPNGLIAKDQIIDATFRSAFATMNQNSLSTVVNSYGYKEYDFRYLLPDSFDGCLSDRINGAWTQKLKIDGDALMSEDKIQKLMKDTGLKNEIEFEVGNTIIRNSEVRSDDYVRFRMGDKPQYLNGNSMPVYKNSFYFYFGLKNGFTALDVFKSQYYAPCAPQVLSAPKGDMRLTVEWPDDIDMLDKFQFNVKISLRGTEKSSIKNFNLYRIYTDDYHVIESRDYGDTRKIEGFKLPETNIEGQFSGNEYTLTGVPFGTYEMVLHDEYGSEFIDDIIVGKDFLTISYDKDSRVDYVKSVANDDLQKDGASYDSGNPIKLGNGGYIPGKFTIEGTPDKANYRIVVKRVTYDANEDFRKFECVKNSDRLYTPKNSWSTWFDSSNKRLYLWGYGTYEVWVRSVNKSGYVSECKYDTFVINDGVELTFSLGDKNLGLGTIMYDSLYKLESKYGEWWNKPEVFSDDNVFLSSDEKYLLYRAVTDYSNFNTTKGIDLHTKYVGSERGMEVLYGEGCILSGDTWVVKKNELMLQMNNANIMTAADDGYVLNTTTIHNAMNESRDSDSRNYPLLYTNVDVDFKRWGTVFCNGTLEKGIFKTTIEQSSNYDKLIGVLGTYGVQNIFLLCDKNNKFYLVNCRLNSDGVLVTLNGNAGYDSSTKLEKGECTLIHLSKLPVLRKEFKYVGIVTRGVNTGYILSTDNSFIESQTVAYNIKAKSENRFKISVYDYKYIGNDIYNNITHNFTPTSGNADFTTRYDGTNILNRDSVMGDNGVILEIPISYLDNINEREKLYTFLNENTKDNFISGRIAKGNYLCQVFTSKSSVGGIFYYVLKLGKNETDTIE